MVVRILVHINGNALLDVSVKDDLTLVNHNAPVAQSTNRIHVVTDIQNCPPLRKGHIAHFIQTLLLKRHIPDGKHLVHDQNFRVKMSRHGKRQFDKHSAGITLDRRVYKFSDFRKFDDIIHLPVDLGFFHPEDRAVHVDIFPACHFAVEACSDLQHGGDSAVYVDGTARRRGHTTEQL